MEPASLHRLCFAAKHHDTQEPSQRRERRSGRKDRQGSPLPQPHGIRKPTYRKPAQQPDQYDNRRRQHHQQPKQDQLQRQLWYRCQLDALQRQQTAEYLETAADEQPHCRTGRGGEREHHRREHYADLRTDSLCSRSRQGK